MPDIDKIKKYLAEYDGPEMNIMEVCGSHTGAIARFGIPGMLSDRIHLISGPGCPVCVTPSAYIDRLIELSLKPDTCVVTFGDLLRVPGSVRSLSQAKGEGARVEMVYAPTDMIRLAEQDPATTFVFAAVGFETTMPAYALLLEEVLQKHLTNVKLLTALKTMPEIIEALMESGAKIDAFIAPGHVSVITGSEIYRPLAERWKIPFGVAGFEGQELLHALYGIVLSRGCGRVMNFYPQVVTEKGNLAAQAAVAKYFEPADAVWRGIGMVKHSGRVLRPAYENFDAGSRSLNDDHKVNTACCCDRILTGAMRPSQCPLFGKVCTPLSPQGACMVSTEGSCFSWYSSHRMR
ncbi:MAG: hydrogenase formation protein HypD [Eubacterium sp.]|nr:hydrogenase formation protein HypD [Eubacterium sp.]